METTPRPGEMQTNELQKGGVPEKENGLLPLSPALPVQCCPAGALHPILGQTTLTPTSSCVQMTPTSSHAQALRLEGVQGLHFLVHAQEEDRTQYRVHWPRLSSGGVTYTSSGWVAGSDVRPH